MDDDGYVKIVGRMKDMIIRGGETSTRREIEELLVAYRDRRGRGDRRAE
jgi:fatty-acyl-CoA synthase